MKNRLKNWMTTTIGVVILIMAFVMFFIGKLDVTGFGATLVLGGTYLAAKDTLINGITLGATNIKSDEKCVD